MNILILQRHQRNLINHSEDLDKINRELVEAVKFRFVSKNLIGKVPYLKSENLLDVQQLQENSIDNSISKNSIGDLVA